MGCVVSKAPVKSNAADAPARKSRGERANCHPGGQPEEVDVLIVGGGFSGCWFADRLKTAQPGLKVLMVESSKRIGGRLMSDNNDRECSTVKDELGGMRVFPDVMPKVVELLNRFHLDLVPLELGDATNLFDSGGVTVRKQDGAMPPGGKWAGKSPNAMSGAAVDAYKATPFWEGCKHDAYECPELRGLNITEFFVKYADATPEEIAQWFTLSGYNLYHDDVQASIYVQDGELYGSGNMHHHFVRQGFSELVVRLKEASGVPTRMETRVTAVRKDGVSQTGEKIVATLDRQGQQQEVTASKVIIGVAAPQLEQIAGWEAIVSPARAAAARASKPIALFKCFLDFKAPWWRKHGFMHGKSTSDTDLRQCHYYDEDDLLIYVSDGDGGANSGNVVGADYASRWGREFAADKPAALRRMFDEVKRIHIAAGVPEEDIIDPNWEDCVHAYWPCGSHKWKKGADVHECIRAISDGHGDGSELYIMGDAFSDLQGWVQGALNTAELAYESAFPSTALMQPEEVA